MPADWSYADGVLVVTETGLTSNEELEQVVGQGAMSELPPGTLVLYDARTSVNALTAEDVDWRIQGLAQLGAQGRVSKLALLVRPQRVGVELMRAEIAKLVPTLASSVFDDDAEARRWLLSR